MFHSASLNVRTCTSLISSPEKLDNVWKHYTRKMFRVQCPWYSNFAMYFECVWIYWQFEWRVQCVRALLWQPTAPHESWVSASLSSFDMALSTGDPSTPWHCMPYVLQCLAQEIYSTLQPVTNSTLPYLASNFSQLSLSDKGAFWLGPGHKISHKCVAV